MEEDEALSEHLLALAQEPNCGDNALLRFVDRKTESWRGTPSMMNTKSIQNQGCCAWGQLWRQNALEEYARRFAAGMRGPVDEVEVVLAFRVRLYKDLQLPGHPSQIRFEDVVGDIDEGVENARETILRNQDEDTLSLWMVNQSFWNKYLEHAYGSRLKLPREYRKKEQELSSRGGTRQEFDALQAQVKQWRLNQRLALTKAAMRRLVSDWHLSTPGQLV